MGLTMSYSAASMWNADAWSILVCRCSVIASASPNIDFASAAVPIKALIAGCRFCNPVDQHLDPSHLVALPAGLAALLRKMLAALNAREIPTAHSILEAFNTELLHKCLQLYVDTLSRLALPAAEERLEQEHAKALAMVRDAALRARRVQSDAIAAAGRAGAARLGARTASERNDSRMPLQSHRLNWTWRIQAMIGNLSYHII